MGDRKGNFMCTTECSGNIVVTDPAEQKTGGFTFKAVVKVWL